MNKQSKAKQVQYIAMADIEPNDGQLLGLPANPREIHEDKYKKLKKNIEQYPELLEYRSLMVYPMPNSSKYIIIGGNMRYRALTELGCKQVPCIVIDPATPVEKLAAYTILDNNGFGRWDFDMLANEWSDFDLDGWGLDLNFNKFEVEEQSYPIHAASASAPSHDVFALPPELADADLVPDELPKIEGKNETENERVIIVYPKSKENALAQLLGMESITKIVYTFDEIDRTVNG